MNKKRVDEWVLIAKDAVIRSGIAENGKVPKGYRGQISGFGSAVVMGSLTSAVAFFVDKGDADVDRPRLLQALYFVIFGEMIAPEQVLAYVCQNESKELREKFVDAAIAVKLAMNFFDLT